MLQEGLPPGPFFGSARNTALVGPKKNREGYFAARSLSPSWFFILFWQEYLGRTNKKNKEGRTGYFAARSLTHTLLAFFLVLAEIRPWSDQQKEQQKGKVFCCNTEAPPRSRFLFGSCKKTALVERLTT